MLTHLHQYLDHTLLSMIHLKRSILLLKANLNSIPFGDIYVTNDEDTRILPQVVNPPPLTQTNLHVASMIHTQTQGDNQTQLTPTPSPSRERLADEINQL
ncbi:hypothetical protein Tco_1361801 [Tanacetum coccineum]